MHAYRKDRTLVVLVGGRVSEKCHSKTTLFVLLLECTMNLFLLRRNMMSIWAASDGGRRDPLRLLAQPHVVPLHCALCVSEQVVTSSVM